MNYANSLVYTNDKCIGCNKCISVCSSIGACVATKEGEPKQIHVDPNKCIACGACFDVCRHGAREYNDDTLRFFEDLKNGKKISVLIAPSFLANYPDEYSSVLGGLKKLGINHMISVSFGADITTWAYLNYISNNNFEGGISQPCPAVVAYIERHIPSLIPKLFPVQSPLLCSAIYAKKYMGIEDDLAFISPCIAKKLEIDDTNTHGYVSYNITFNHLMDYVRKNGVSGPAITDEIEYGLGAIYPTPGGLLENIKWFLGEDAFVKRVDGEKRMYHYLEKNKESLKGKNSPYTCIDALNCSGGCLYGTGCEADKNGSDDAFVNLHTIKNNILKKEDDLWAECISPRDRLNKLNEYFSDLNPDDFRREYSDKSDMVSYKIPTDEERNEIFVSMNKMTKEEREINCSCCGYDSCVEMADAIYNGFNNKSNCIFYLRQEMNEQKQNAIMANKANKAKDTFLANMSHEIRTPINAVLGMNEMIIRESKDINMVSYARKIREAGQSLLTIVNDILDISKIESGKMEITPVDYCLPELFRKIFDINESIIKEKKIDFNVKLKNDIPVDVYGDDARIRQIIMNLVSNAIKYTNEGSIIISVATRDFEDDKFNLVVSVEDTGIGISEDDMGILFDKFQRLDLKNNRSIEGTGLGLSICKNFAEYMNGTITVESEKGKGSIFTLKIPQVCKSNRRTSDIFQSDFSNDDLNWQVDYSASKASVLVVDDLEMNVIVLSELLKTYGVKTDTAMCGADAIKMCHNKKYDVILLDHMMPEMDGVETLINIRHDTEGFNVSTPIIVQTANAMRGVREDYLSKGFNDCIFKPIDPKILGKTLFVNLPKELID